MYYINLPIYAQILWIVFGLIVLLPWITIPAVAIYQFFKVKRMPKLSTANQKSEINPITGKLAIADNFRN